MIAEEALSKLYRKACEIELQAFKPGNVSIYADGHDMTVADFRLSAEVSAAPLCNPEFNLGEKIYYAAQATREAVGSNTNLGIILLCAPLVQAVYHLSPTLTFRQSLEQILTTTTIADANWAFKAIALANPGGLGEIKEQDVHQEATMNLREAMRLASNRDMIAKQYADEYKDIFDFAVFRYNSRLSQWSDQNWAAVFLYADLLCRFPDSHIERKHGNKYTAWVAATMRQFIEEFGKTTDPRQALQTLYCLDAEFKSSGVNPGTTADMTVATILSVLIEEQLSHNKN